MVCRGKALRYETPTPSPLAGAESLLADGAFAASFGGLGNWLLPLLLACHLQAGTRFHGIGQRAENGCGWKSLLGRLANGSGQGVAHLLGAPGGVGVPPRIKWSLPDGMRAGELLYSPPQRVKMGQVGAHGNYGETLFLCRFDPVVPLDRGSVVKISGRASGWPAPVNAGRALPICSSKFSGGKKSNMILFGGRSSSPFGKPFPVIHPRSGASGLFARATKSIFSFPPSFPAEAGIYFFPLLVGRSDHMPRNFSAKTGVGGFFP